MTDLDSILDALADALELERELGARVVACERGLLTVGARRETRDGSRDERQDARRETRDENRDARRETGENKVPFLFLHDRPLSPKGVEMMAKIVAAMHLTPETAPILFTGDRPAARVTVVLGLRALRHWFPGAAGSPGQWISPGGAQNVLVTYSPEYILRLGAETPSVRALKRGMWLSLKGALQRIGNEI